MIRRKKRVRQNTFKGRYPNRRAAAWARLGLAFRVLLVTGGFVLFNLALILTYDAITQTDRLEVRSVTVTGCRRLTPATVEAQAGLSGVRNILAVNLSTTRKRLLAHPWIAEAQVTRAIPGRLQIHIREHTCLAVLNLGRRFLLSDTGIVFKELEPGETPDVPVVSGLTYADLNLQVEATTPLMRSVLTFLRPRPQSGLQALTARVREIHADPVLGLTVFLADDHQPGGYRTVMLGFDDFEAKYDMLKKIDAYLQHRPRYAGYRSIDLNNRKRIIVHPMATGAAEDARKEV